MQYDELSNAIIIMIVRCIFTKSLLATASDAIGNRQMGFCRQRPRQMGSMAP